MFAHVVLLAGERRRRGKTDRRSTELSTIIRNCLEQTILLELMPSSQIDVYVQVLQVGQSPETKAMCEYDYTLTIWLHSVVALLCPALPMNILRFGVV